LAALHFRQFTTSQAASTTYCMVTEGGETEQQLGFPTRFPNLELISLATFRTLHQGA